MENVKLELECLQGDIRLLEGKTWGPRVEFETPEGTHFVDLEDTEFQKIKNVLLESFKKREKELVKSI